MKSDDVIARLRGHERELRARGVAHASLFGSVARGEAGPDSDVDIMLEFDRAAGVSVYDYVEIKEYIGDLFDVKVDVVDRAALKPYVRPPADRDAIRAF